MRRTLALVLALLSLGACGDVEVRTFRLHVENPSSEAGAVPFRVGVVHGRAVEASSLRVKVTDETGAIYEFDVVPGTTLAFAADEAAVAGLVTLPGADAAALGPAESLARVRTRLAEQKLPAVIREPAEGKAFLVGLEDDREDQLAEVVAAASASTDLRFLIEVRPRERYRAWRDDGSPAPRLEAPPYPWDGTAEAFGAFKEAEAAAWREALEAGRPYRPSDERYLVLPRYGTEGTAAKDFRVLEWPAEERYRFDQRMLENPVATVDEMQRPAIFYDVRPEYQEAFETFTEVNVGLPMAIVIDWMVTSAPSIRSPLSERVQITLGSGSMRTLEARAEHLVAGLQAGGPVLPARLVALARWGRDGAFEVWVPIPETGEIRVAVEARDAANAHRAESSIPLRYVPTAPTSAKQAVRAAVAEILLDLVTPEDAAPPLRAHLPDSVTELVALLSSDAPLARRIVAVDLLGRVDAASEAALAALLEAQEAASVGLRLTAATALARLEPSPRQREALERAVGDADPKIQVAAIGALAKAGGGRAETVAALLGAGAGGDPMTREAVFSALHSLLPDARAALERAAREGEPAQRTMAVQIFAMVEDRAAVELLVSLLENEVARVRLAALGALAYHAGAQPREVERHVEAIAQRLDDPDESVGTNAAVTLGMLGEAAVPALRAALSSGNEGVRAGALQALAHMESLSPSVLDEVRGAASDENEVVRLLAAWTLSRHGTDPERLPEALRTSLAGGNQHARALAVSFAWMRAGDLKSLHPLLVPYLDHETEDMRVYAAAALERMEQASERTQAILAPIRADPDHRLHAMATFPN